METFENTSERLRNAALGSEVNIGCLTLKVKEADDRACMDCAFRTEMNKVVLCPYIKACMGRYRPDRKSVVFSIVESLGKEGQ